MSGSVHRWLRHTCMHSHVQQEIPNMCHCIMHCAADSQSKVAFPNHFWKAKHYFDIWGGREKLGDFVKCQQGKVYANTCTCAIAAQTTVFGKALKMKAGNVYHHPTTKCRQFLERKYCHVEGGESDFNVTWRFVSRNCLEMSPKWGVIAWELY